MLTLHRANALPFGHVSAALAGLSAPAILFGPAGVGIGFVGAIAFALLAPGRVTRVRETAARLRQPLGIAFVAMLVLWLPSIALSSDPMDSLSVWARIIPVVSGAALIFRLLADEPRYAETAFRASIIGTLIVLCLLTIGLYGWGELVMALRGKGFVPIDSWPAVPKTRGMVAACLGPVMVWAGYRLGSWWRWAGLASLPLVVLVIIGVDSNAGLLSFVVGCVVGALAYVAARAGRRRLLAGMVAVLLSCAVGGLVVLFDRLPQAPSPSELSGPTYDGPLDPTLPVWAVDHARQYIWAYALDWVDEAPAFGHGINRSNHLPGAETFLTAVGQEILPSHPHNWVLEQLVDTGVVGLLGVLSALGVLIWRILRWAQVQPAAACAALALSASFWCASLLTVSIWSTWWQAVYLMLLALVAAEATRPAASR